RSWLLSTAASDELLLQHRGAVELRSHAVVNVLVGEIRAGRRQRHLGKYEPGLRRTWRARQDLSNPVAEQRDLGPGEHSGEATDLEAVPNAGVLTVTFLAGAACGHCPDWPRDALGILDRHVERSASGSACRLQHVRLARVGHRPGATLRQIDVKRLAHVDVVAVRSDTEPWIDPRTVGQVRCVGSLHLQTTDDAPTVQE